MVCKKCNSEIPVNATSCNECGALVDVQVPVYENKKETDVNAQYGQDYNQYQTQYAYNPEASYQQPQQPQQPFGQQGYQQPSYGGQPGYQQPPYGGQPGYQQPPYGGQPGYQQPPYGGQPGYQQPPYGGMPNNADVPSSGMNALAFFIPILGLVLYLVWKDQFPVKAKAVGKWALISFISGIVFYVITMIFSIVVTTVSYSLISLGSFII